MKLLKVLLGTWVCPNCGSINLAKDSKCFYCGYRRPR